jgi:ribosome recycling factor
MTDDYADSTVKKNLTVVSGEGKMRIKIPELTIENRDEWLLTEKEQDEAIKKIIAELRGDMPMSALSRDTIKYASYDAIAGATFNKIRNKYNK